jgi:DNA-binding transcriptional ArsR family regulator
MKLKSYVMIDNKTQYDLCFETLSNGLRIKILKSLSENPRTVSELAQELGVEQSRLSHSLSMLRECNYVNVKKEGKQRVYSLKDEILEKKEGNLFEVIDAHVSEFCETCGKIKGVEAK